MTYFYRRRWVLINSYTLVEAIALHRGVKRAGTEIYIFPPDLDPNHFKI
ncbi:MAG: hypothetical protein M3O33_16445 [Cyanobacteriota bacterium]|nr:hypothetical protein [Cyanobacteriota bacterium]